MDSLVAAGILPAPLASQIDGLYASLDTASYYELLDVGITAERSSIQQAYHRLALQMHPDRHNRLKRLHPAGYRRINRVFKRLAEGYRVLMDTNARRRYNVALRSRGETRHTSTNGSPREQRELDLCRTEIARRAVVKSQEARCFGDWATAHESITVAVTAEPKNRQLALLADSIRKFVTIINR